MASTLNPSECLPRDPTGSYLHLKLKRFPSIDVLTMPYAKKTWREVPHNAEIDISPSARSSCRQCHSKILKGDLRMKLWLQCHKGCKMGAYFHGDGCFWEYPETSKLKELNELVGFDELPEDTQKEVKKRFLSLIERKIEEPETKKQKTKK